MVVNYFAQWNGGFVEIRAADAPRLFRFAKWWVQLFGESEGKDNLGLYPLFGNFSEDLHSIGQFLQEGTPVLFETFLDVRHSGASLRLQPDDVDDRFGYLDGKDFDAINRAAYEATLQGIKADGGFR